MTISQKANTIVLIGLSGSGKSSVALALSKQLNFKLIDSDSLIEMREETSIFQIFEQKGEAYFRTIEKETLLQLDLTKDTVIALGGGAWMHSEVRAFLSPVASVVYLELSIESLLARLERDATRPLLNQESDRRRVLEKQLEERISFYKQSTITVNTDVSVGQVVQEIIQKLKLA